MSIPWSIQGFDWIIITPHKSRLPDMHVHIYIKHNAVVQTYFPSQVPFLCPPRTGAKHPQSPQWRDVGKWGGGGEAARRQSNGPIQWIISWPYKMSAGQNITDKMSQDSVGVTFCPRTFCTSTDNFVAFTATFSTSSVFSGDLIHLRICNMSISPNYIHNRASRPTRSLPPNAIPLPVHLHRPCHHSTSPWFSPSTSSLLTHTPTQSPISVWPITSSINRNLCPFLYVLYLFFTS